MIRRPRGLPPSSLALELRCAQGSAVRHEEHAARAGRYRVRVPVYDSDMAAQQGTPSYEVTINFELPAPSGVVVVPIGQSP